MPQNFRIVGLDPAPFAPLHALSDAALEARGMRRVFVDAKPSAPCRITLEDAEIGEAVILTSFLHQPAASPYQQQGPIFIREADRRANVVDAIPPALAVRPLSLRSFDADGWMLDADLVAGAEAGALIHRLFADPRAHFIHAHYARRGCFAAEILRA